MSATMNLDDDLSADDGVGPSAARTAQLRGVRFVCPLCGDDRAGVHVREPDGATWVECDECAYRCDPGILEIPTAAELAQWHAQALRHGQAALRCADGSPTCGYLATVWCRRLASELSLWGKSSFLDSVTRPVAGTLTRDQREVVVQLGVALRMPPSAINQVLTGL